MKKLSREEMKNVQGGKLYPGDNCFCQVSPGAPSSAYCPANYVKCCSVPQQGMICMVY
jgi:hypothetical protein